MKDEVTPRVVPTPPLFTPPLFTPPLPETLPDSKDLVLLGSVFVTSRDCGGKTEAGRPVLPILALAVPLGDPARAASDRPDTARLERDASNPLPLPALASYESSLIAPIAPSEMRTSFVLPRAPLRAPPLPARFAPPA